MRFLIVILLLLLVPPTLSFGSGGSPNSGTDDAIIAASASMGLATDAKVTSQPDLPAGVSSDWWSEVSRYIAADEYTVKTSDGAAYATNRAQNLRTVFTDAGLEVKGRVPATEAAPWSLTWRASSWGRSGAILSLSSPVLQAEGSRVEYRYSQGFTEWYENRTEGLEQGFDITSAPSGTGRLVIEGQYGTGLTASLSQDRRTVDFSDSRGQLVLSYGGLVVRDHSGRELPAELSLADGSLQIRIDDQGADYPIQVDPLMTTPEYIRSSSQAGASFGYCVATAGDVDNDGYSDILVGAPLYDEIGADMGRVFLFRGSADGPYQTAVWHAHGSQQGAWFGASVGTAGDVDGNGYDDVIIGAYAHGLGGRVTAYLSGPDGLSEDPAWIHSGEQWDECYGKCVGTAGDVTGDGYADVFVGAPQHTATLTEEGAVYLYAGGAGGLASGRFALLPGGQAGAHCGASVSTAGDVNGDGYDDVIVGAPDFDGTYMNGGAVFVYAGPLNEPNPTAIATRHGAYANGNFGVAVSLAGDVNGDGYGDVLVGACRYTYPGPDSGHAYLYQGAEDGISSEPTWVTGGFEFVACYGGSLSTAGDVNGDGYADVIVGATYYQGEEDEQGAAFAYLGSADGLSTTACWTVEGDQELAHYGIVAAAGDVNGDGYSDVIVGAPLYDTPAQDAGRVYVYCGAPEGLQETATWARVASTSSSFLGSVVESAGDVNGDGYDDLLACGVRQVRVYHGGASGPSETPSRTIGGGDEDGSICAACAGDVNSDGYSDVIVGTPFAAGGSGRASVYYGSASGLADTPDWSYTGVADTHLGWAVAGAGDVDGNGRSDVIVGAPGYVSDYGGRCYVFRSGEQGLPTTPSWFRAAPEAYLEMGFGSAVTCAGDVNRDGYSDVIIGAPYYPSGTGQMGKAYVYYGASTGLALSPGFVVSGGAGSNDRLGYGVAAAGDVNGDGYADFIIGSPGYQEETGAASVFHGRGGGLDPELSWTHVGGGAVQFGTAVSSAGDINGDGFSDILIGVPYADDSGGSLTDCGRAAVYLGSELGVEEPPAYWTILGSTNGERLGTAVACGGDVNGDGVADIVIGSPYHDHYRGRIQVFSGDGTAAGVAFRPRQQTATNRRIELLCRTDGPSSFRVRADGRSAAGRVDVRLECSAVVLPDSLQGAAVYHCAWHDTGDPVSGTGSTVSTSYQFAGLTPNTQYHWRLRVASKSPYFPWTPWMSPARTAPSLAHLRTIPSGGKPPENEETALGGGKSFVPRIDGVNPNPFCAGTSISFNVPSAGPVQVAVYDLTGRRVRGLVSGQWTAGNQVVSWDGRDESGRLAESGVYFVKLQTSGQEQTVKLVLTR